MTSPQTTTVESMTLTPTHLNITLSGADRYIADISRTSLLTKPKAADHWTGLQLPAPVVADLATAKLTRKTGELRIAAPLDNISPAPPPPKDLMARPFADELALALDAAEFSGDARGATPLPKIPFTASSWAAATAGMRPVHFTGRDETQRKHWGCCAGRKE